MFRPLPDFARIMTAGLSVWLFFGCSDSTPEAEKAVRTFIEAYYIRADLVAARRTAVGLAREKIDRQMKLRKDRGEGRSVEQTSPGVGRNRKVEADVLEVRDRVNGDKVYRFRLTIFNSAIRMGLQTLITVGKRHRSSNGPWMVVNFMEIRDLPSEKSREIIPAPPGSPSIGSTLRFRRTVDP